VVIWGLEGLTVVVAEDLALLADAGAWFGHGFDGVCGFFFVVVVVKLVGVATKRERESRVR
jgi:hypothetical protein